MTTISTTAWVPFAGGAIMGLCSSLKLLLTGRIFGVSGAVAGLLRDKAGRWWRVAFLGGLLGGGMFLRMYHPTAFYPFPSGFPIWKLVVGGLLVGAGTNIGNGCNIGHGISGVSRLAPRSIANVVTYMTTGVAVATLMQSANEVVNPKYPLGGTLDSTDSETLALVGASLQGLMTAAFGVISEQLIGQQDPRPLVVCEATSLVTEMETGALFALGLGVSGLLSPLNTLRFLDMSDMRVWDPSVLVVAAGALTTALPFYQWIVLNRAKKGLPPLLGGQFTLPKFEDIDWKVIVGGILFGAGWGLCGLTTDSGLLSLLQPDPEAAIYFCSSAALGMLASSCVPDTCK